LDPRETKGFRIWIPSKHKTIARDVRFLEEIIDIVEDSSILDDLTEESTIGLNEKSIESSLHGHFDLVQINSIVSVQPIVAPPHEPATQCEVLRRASSRVKLLHTGARRRFRKLFRTEVLLNKEAEENPTEENGEEAANSYDVFVGVAEVSVHEILESKNCEEWKKAVENEMMSLLKNDT